MPLNCLRCASEKVAEDVEVRLSMQGRNISNLQTIRLAVDLDPNVSKFFAGLGKEYESCGLTARVCGDCGHVELVAEDGLRLYTAATGTKLLDPK